MKPTPKPAKALPKAKVRVMYDRPLRINPLPYRLNRDDIPVLVLPMPTAKQARAAARFWNLGREQQVEAIAEALYNQHTIIGSLGGMPWSDIEWTDCEHDNNIRNFWMNHGRAILTLISPTK